MKLLVFVDHAEFSDFDSVFRLTGALSRLWWSEVHVASRSDPMNAGFWQDPAAHPIWTRRADAGFTFESGAGWFLGRTTPHPLTRFHGGLFKIEPPLDVPWLKKLQAFEDRISFINTPHGMMEAASKLFLDHFADHIPGFSVCHTVEEAREQVRLQGSVVFKPAYGSGGRGLMRVGEDGIWIGARRYSRESNGEVFDKAVSSILPCISMAFLPHVVDGDKRIIVFDGKIMGAILRLPKKGSWLANVQQGGGLICTRIEPEEYAMIEDITPVMRDHGIAIYGADTLEADDGTRVLSEVNAANPDGLVQAETISGFNVIKPLAKAIRRHFAKQLSELRR